MLFRSETEFATPHSAGKTAGLHDASTHFNTHPLTEKPNEVLAPQTERSELQNRSEVIEQVQRHLENMRLAGGKGDMAFHLRPGYLGDIRIHINSTSEGVVARILTENHPVQQALEGAKESLRQSLEQRGLNLVRFEVALSQGGMTERQYSSPNPQNAFQTRQPGRNLSRTASITEAINSVEPKVKPTLSLRREGISLLDYSA